MKLFLLKRIFRVKVCSWYVSQDMLLPKFTVPNAISDIPVKSDNRICKNTDKCYNRAEVAGVYHGAKMVMEEIRLGTIGTGNIVRSILNAVRLTDGIRHEAVYSRTQDKGQALAQEYGADKVYTDMDRLLADPDVNFIYVASPNNMHYSQVKTALKHGKNVICEKPFCAKRAMVLELKDLAIKKGLFLIDATPTAFLPNYMILKEQIKRIGRIRLVICNYSQYSSRYDLLKKGEVPNVFNPEFEGGALQDIGYYDVYIAAALFGWPDSITYYPNICCTGVDTSGIMVMKYPGFLFEGSAAKDTRGVNFLQIEGEEGYIYVDNGPNGIAKVRTVIGGNEEVFDEQPDPSGWDELKHPELSNRWYYEIQEMTRLVLEDNYQELYRRLDITADCIGMIEKARLDAGIIFPE